MVFWCGFPAADALLQIWHPVTLILLRLITVLFFFIRCGFGWKDAALYKMWRGRVGLSLGF